MRASFPIHNVKQRRATCVGWAKARSAVPTPCITAMSFRVGFASLSPPYEEEKRRKRNAGRRSVLCPARKRRAVRATKSRLAPPSAVGRARLSAFHHGSRQRESSSLRLSFRPGFLGCGAKRCGLARQRRSQFQRCTSHTGHSAGRHDARSRPGAKCKSARGHRTRPDRPVCLRTASF